MQRVTIAVALAAVVALFAQGCSKSTAPMAAMETPAFAEMSPAAQLAQIKDQLETSKATIAESGDHYHCCIDPSCNWCALMMGACECGHNVPEDKPVCPECVMGWRMGMGDIPDIEPASVKNMMDMGDEHMMEMDEGHTHEGGHEEHAH